MYSKNKTIIFTFSLSFPPVNLKHFHKATGTQEYKHNYQHLIVLKSKQIYKRKKYF